MTQLHVDAARIGGWIFVHTKDKNTMSFGPFEDYEDLRMWLATIGDEHGINGMAIPLVNPASDPLSFAKPLYRIVEPSA